MRNQTVRFAAIVFFLLIGEGEAAPAPRIALASLNALPIAIEKPYDSAANADATVEAAFTHARASGKRVLIDLGGNWCPDCIILANIMRLPELAPFVDAHFEVVMVDVGRFSKNLQIPARFGITHRLEGVPYVLIVSPEGKLINASDTVGLDEARRMEPQAIADWLAKWTN